ncbi:glycosyltransferase [Fulvivirgaceae bacterium BMA10]|uniref:Glycosyltransferase n=1 Tax=Splendidivirga corallicola TaxID=3051826 RepID=A0ABT8KK70_9BACT|nr:glycosyltransferase [Fulvivirgaceae bacterium BMA10]
MLYTILFFFLSLSFFALALYAIYHLASSAKLGTLVLALVLIAAICTSVFIESLFFIEWYALNILQTITAFFLMSYMLLSLLFYKRKPVDSNPPGGTLPKVSVLVAVHNEEEVIEETIKNLLQLEYDAAAMEIVVINDNSTDNTKSILEQFKDKIRIVDRTPGCLRGKPAAINEVIPLLSSEIICVFDADSLPEKNFLKKAVGHFSDNKVGLVQCRNVQYNENTSIISRLVGIDIDSLHLSLYYPKSLYGMPIFEGRAGLFRRSVFIKLDGYDTNLPTEDWDFGYKVQISGHKLVYDPHVYNHEQATDTMSEYVKQRYRWLSTTILTFLKNFKPVLRTNSLGVFQKFDSFFILFFNIWAIVFNLIGFIGFCGKLMGYQFNGSIFLMVFLSMVVFYNSPSILFQKKIKHLLFFPFMYLYYWSFTVIISVIFIDKFVLKRDMKYKKATHNQRALNRFRASFMNA